MSHMCILSHNWTPTERPPVHYEVTRPLKASQTVAECGKSPHKSWMNGFFLNNAKTQGTRKKTHMIAPDSSLAEPLRYQIQVWQGVGGGGDRKWSSVRFYFRLIISPYIDCSYLIILLQFDRLNMTGHFQLWHSSWCTVYSAVVQEGVAAASCRSGTLTATIHRMRGTVAFEDPNRVTEEPCNFVSFTATKWLSKLLQAFPLLGSLSQSLTVLSPFSFSRLSFPSLSPLSVLSHISYLFSFSLHLPV